MTQVRIAGIDFLVASRLRTADPLGCLGDLEREFRRRDAHQRFSSSLVRTWWIIPDTSDSYARFAAARRERLCDLGFREPGPWPASTCIRRGRIGRAAVMAVAPSSRRVEVERVSSEGIAPEPISYGYVYDRAVLVRSGPSRVLLVSATAGLAADGTPVERELEPQFHRALGIVDELVARARMKRDQVRRLVVWRDSAIEAARAAELVRLCRRVFPNAACTSMRGGIVRDGFLTEIEALAGEER